MASLCPSYKGDHGIFVLLCWLPLLSIMSSRLTHFVTHGRIALFFKSESGMWLPGVGGTCGVLVTGSKFWLYFDE